MRTTDPYSTRMRSGPALPQVPSYVDLAEALSALRRCFDDSGALLVKPEASQFRPVGEHEIAISILDACDIALRGHGSK